MSKRIENEIRQRVEAMYNASVPVEELTPTGFDGREDQAATRDEQVVFVRRPVRARKTPHWAAGIAAATAAVLLIAVPLLLLSNLGSDTATAPNVPITQILYADGDINDCPDNLADDTSHPAGQITYQPVPQGIDIRIVLQDASPNWAYVVHVFEAIRSPSEPCGIGLETLTGLTTDSQGNGTLTHVLPLPAGVHSVGVNIAYDTIEPPEPHHREISTNDYATLTVPHTATQ